MRHGDFLKLLYFDDSSVSIFYYWLHGNLNKIAPS